MTCPVRAGAAALAGGAAASVSNPSAVRQLGAVVIRALIFIFVLLGDPEFYGHARCALLCSEPHVATGIAATCRSAASLGCSTFQRKHNPAAHRRRALPSKFVLVKSLIP